MNREQVKKVLDILKLNYPNYINENNKAFMLEEWCKELNEYSFDDTIERIKQVMSEERYQMKPPTLYYITNGMIKLKNKIDYNEDVHYCDNCHRPFNDLNQMMEHRARENSIEYIIRESKKWFNKTFDKEGIDNLYEMSEEEFDTRYKKLLKYIYDHTDNEFEKQRIGCIFNPPEPEEAKKIMNVM